MINVNHFFQEFGVDYATEHRHSSTNWVQVRDCPYCDSVNYHLGVHTLSPRVNCWKCGSHPFVEAMSLVAGISPVEFKQYVEDFGSSQISLDWIEKKPTVHKAIEPSGLVDLTRVHKRYLSIRDFNHEKLKLLYQLKATTFLAEGDWKWRIILPVIENGKIMCYTGRTIGNSEPKYKSSKKEESVKGINDCLYGIDQVMGDEVVIVEGPTDVWRLGPGSVATFGIDWSLSQVKLLLERNIKKAWVMYDSEAQALKQADKLKTVLNSVGIKTGKISIQGYKDPGCLPQERADKIMKLHIDWR
jgi:hypothetical protein